MSDDDILDLVVGPTLRERPLSGHMDAISLTASYDFSRAEYENGEPTSRAIRTIRHETTHAYQTLATSYGYYFQLIKQFQTSRVLHILAGLDALGADLAPPLITQIARQHGDHWRQLRIELHAWYLAEVVLIHLEGEHDHWTRILLENRAFAGRTFPDLYVELEEMLVLWLTGLGHRVGVAPGPPRDSSPAMDIHLRALTDNGSTAAILESAAHINEHWRVYPPDLETLRRQLPASTQYSSWIRWALAADFSDDPATFCLTFSALADLALNSALLPHQAGFRQPGYDANSVSPPHRMFWQSETSPAATCRRYANSRRTTCHSSSWSATGSSGHSRGTWRGSSCLPCLRPTNSIRSARSSSSRRNCGSTSHTPSSTSTSGPSTARWPRSFAVRSSTRSSSSPTRYSTTKIRTCRHTPS